MHLFTATAAVTAVPQVSWVIYVGWFVSVISGVLVGLLADRRRFLNGLRSQIAMIREDVELAHDNGDDGFSPANSSVKSVWKRSVPLIRPTVFAALPYTLLPWNKKKLIEYWKSVRDFDIDIFYDRDSNEIVDRVIFQRKTETKKQALLRTLGSLETYIG